MKFPVALSPLCLLLPASPAHAQAPDYPDFSSTAGLTLNGTAMQNGTELRLTTNALSEKGSFFFDQPVAVSAGFETTFEFRFTDPIAGGGDGMAFVVHNDARTDTALTEHASALGYGRFAGSPPDTGILNSIAFEVDTFANTNWNDTNGNHISVHTNATLENTQDELLSIGEAQPSVTLGDGGLHTVRVCYVPGTLEVFVDDLTNPLLSIPYDFATGGSWINGGTVGGLDLINGTSAWVGFTASNGGSTETHDLISWDWDQCGSGTPICFGDGSSTACPCGNLGASGEGCANSTGAGALLSSSGGASLSNDSLVLTATQTTNQPGIFFQGDNSIAAPPTFGDGIRCCGTNVVRIGTYLPAGGTTDTANGNLIGGVGAPISAHPGNAALQAGDTRCYQWWYRDPGGSNPCGIDFFNLSNGLEVAWGA